ncbi:unnamed protein product [Rhizoctonia solani]|uniref:Uncharacterized protein n=1 Tax=Rhizoctonia solani TaxID=456999 RepID=A0A8H2XDB0_9AGAM|nr:unnamed protein product [Rhizoctonia solani]
MDAGFGSERRGTTWLLGWYDDEIAGRLWTSCLRQIGGFTINDAKFLVEQSWSARTDFLSVAMAGERQRHLYGWGSFLHVVWRILGNNYGIGSGHVGRAGPQTSDQRQCWVRFADISARYALCSSEAEDSLMPAFLANCPSFSQPWSVAGTGSAIGASDSNRIVQAFSTKLQSRPKLHISFSSMLLGYACKNLKAPDISSPLSRVFQSILERSWVEVARIQELNSEQFNDLLYHTVNLLSALMGLLTTNPEQARYLLDVISSDTLVEFLGRLIFLPLLITEETLHVLESISTQRFSADIHGVQRPTRHYYGNASIVNLNGTAARSVKQPTGSVNQIHICINAAR